MLKVGDEVKYRRTRRRTWTVVRIGEAGALTLQRQGYRGRLVTRTTDRAVDYRKVDPADFLPHQYIGILEDRK